MKAPNPSDKYALVILKPDSLNQYLDPVILDGLERKGLQIVKRKLLVTDRHEVDRFYAEKKGYNYYPLLQDYLTSSPSMCLVVKSHSGNAIRLAKDYRDWARLNLKLNRFELTEEDVALLNRNEHPFQREITKEMALENLIHVADDFEKLGAHIKRLFNEWEIKELQVREPELHRVLNQRQKEVPKEAGTEIILRPSTERE